MEKPSAQIHWNIKGVLGKFKKNLEFLPGKWKQVIHLLEQVFGY
jgi:hypothetical protein